MTNHTTPRRAFLVGLATVPALAVPALASPGADPDAELVRLGREWRERFDFLETEPAAALPNAEWDALFDKRFAVEKAILDTPAAGLAGLAVKAAIAQRYGADAYTEIHEGLIKDVLQLAS